MTPRQALCRARRLILFVWLAALVASSAHAAPPVFRVYSPAPGERLTDGQFVAVQVLSPVPIADMSARLADRSVSLASGSDGFFTGLLALDGVPRGSKLLTVAATDTNGQKSQVMIPVLVDRDPMLTVQSPADLSVWSGNVSLMAACVDDTPGACVVRAVADGVTVASGTRQISVSQALRPTASGIHTIQFVAVDGLQHTSTRTVLVFDATARALPVDVAPGRLLIDATADRLLSATDGFASMMITDRASHTTETIERPPGALIFDGLGTLTEHGAVLSVIDGFPASESIWEWRDGGLLSLGPLAGGRFVIKGSFLAWLSPLSSVTGQEVLQLRNLASGTTVAVDVLAVSPFSSFEFDLTADGVLTYGKPTSAGSGIWRYANGTSERVTFPPPGAYDTAPRNDGALTVFSRRSVADGTTTISLTDNGREETLATCVNDPCNLQVGGEYDVEDGWVAFIRRAHDGTSSLWLRRPDGTQRQLSSLAPSGLSTPYHDILRMAAGGSVQYARRLVDSYNEPVVQLIDAPAGREPSIVLESNGGRPVWIENELHVMLDRVLLRVIPPPPRPLITIDVPGRDWVPYIFDVAGWALDKSAMDGSGIDAVHVWAYPADGGAPTFVGAAGLGAARPDVAAAFGPQYGTAGFSLSALLPEGTWTLTAFAHSAFTNTFVASASTTTNVVNTTAHVTIDAPVEGSLRGPFVIRGWALDLSSGTPPTAPGTGIDTVHVYAYRDNGQAIFLGAAVYGDLRQDVAGRWGDRYLTSGFHLAVNTLPAGHYRLAVFARRTATFTFAPAQVREVTVKP